MLEITTEIFSSFSKLSGVTTNSKFIRIFIATPPFQRRTLKRPSPFSGKPGEQHVGGGEMSISQLPE